jgi:hypothetical protein
MTSDSVLLKPRATVRVAATERAPWRRMAPFALLPVAVGLWIVSLRHVDLRRMGSYGLVDALPATYWIALLLTTVGFVLVLLRPRVNMAWLAGHVVALIVMLHATPALLYGTLRYSWAWKHVAVVDYLLRHDGTDTTNGDLGVYHQWPGFFTLNALLVRAAGLSSSLSYAQWAPVINNLLLIAPLVLLYRSMTSNRRLVWTGVWVFFICAWVGQDYFSPQAFAFVLYVTVIALVLNRLKQPPDVRRRGSLTWFLLMLPLILAIVTSHQLTPLILVSVLGILSISRTRWRTTLPLFGAAAVLTVAWWATVARPFIEANLHSILKSFGTLDTNVGSSLGARNVPDPAQRLIVHVELGAAIVISALAVVAVVLWRDLRRGPALLLALAPIPLLVANDYGGEILFRAYLFALPGTAFLCAAMIYRLPWRPGVRAAVSLAVLPALLVGFVLAYYGKERQNYFSPAEVAASRYMFATAPHGSLIVGATSEYPAGYTNYEYYARLSWLGGLSAEGRAEVERDPAAALDAFMRDSKGRPAYFILTRSQEAEVQQSGLLSADALARVEQIPGIAPQFKVVYRNSDAAVLVLASPPPGAAAPGGR